MAFGVNDSREVVGTYMVGTGSKAKSFGFIWARDFGFRTVNDPHGSGATTLNGINDAGDLVGFYTDARGNTDGLLVAHGHFRAPLAPPLTTTPMPTATPTVMPTPTTPAPCRPGRARPTSDPSQPATHQPPQSRRAGPEHLCFRASPTGLMPRRARGPAPRWRCGSRACGTVPRPAAGAAPPTRSGSGHGPRRVRISQ